MLTIVVPLGNVTWYARRPAEHAEESTLARPHAHLHRHRTPSIRTSRGRQPFARTSPGEPPPRHSRCRRRARTSRTPTGTQRRTGAAQRDRIHVVARSVHCRWNREGQRGANAPRTAAAGRRSHRRPKERSGGRPSSRADDGTEHYKHQRLPRATVRHGRPSWLISRRVGSVRRNPTRHDVRNNSPRGARHRYAARYATATSRTKATRLARNSPQAERHRDITKADNNKPRRRTDRSSECRGQETKGDTSPELPHRTTREQIIPGLREPGAVRSAGATVDPARTVQVEDSATASVSTWSGSTAPADKDTMNAWARARASPTRRTPGRTTPEQPSHTAADTEQRSRLRRRTGSKRPSAAQRGS